MKRRQFFNAAIGIGNATALRVSAKSAKPKYVWNMATSWPKTLDTIYYGAKIVCERVAQMTNNDFIIKPFPAGEIVPALNVLDAVSRGNWNGKDVQCGHTASFYYAGDEKKRFLVFGTGVPFGLNAQQQNAWLYEGKGLELMQGLYRDQFHVIQFPAGNSGVQMGGWFKKPVNTLADLNGLKMRIPGLGGDVMAKLNVKLVNNIESDKLADALKNGIIDAAEWIGPYDDEKLGLHTAGAAFYYYPGWWEPSDTFEVQVNLKAWEGLPEHYQEVFKAACAEANVRVLARYDTLNREALGRLIASGTKVTPFPKDILKEAKKEAFKLYDEYAKDQPFQEVYKQWKDFRQKIYQWHGVNELEFGMFSFNL